MTGTYFDVFVWVASASLGFLIYDQLVRPVLLYFMTYLKRKAVAWKVGREQREFIAGAQWAWGQYGTGSLTPNAIKGYTGLKWGDRTSFQRGVADALKDILIIDDLKATE